MPGVAARQAPLGGFREEVTLKLAVCRPEWNCAFPIREGGRLVRTSFSYPGGRQIGEDGPGYRLETGAPLNAVHLCQASQRPRGPPAQPAFRTWVEKARALKVPWAFYTAGEPPLAGSLGSP